MGSESVRTLVLCVRSIRVVMEVRLSVIEVAVSATLCVALFVSKDPSKRWVGRQVDVRGESCWDAELSVDV